jgi:uncharacterized protein
MSSSSSKALLAVFCGLFFAATPTQDYAPYPRPDSGYVTDLGGLLSPQEEERIEQWLIRVEASSRTEIIVVTINSIGDYPGTDNASIETFATALFNRWGIGNRPANDGILLLVAVRDRKARIELGAGYPASRNADATAIMQNLILPKFRDGKYAAGITNGVKAIVNEFTTTRIGLPWKLIGVGTLFIVCVLVSISLFMSGRRGWGWVFAGFALLLLLVLVYLIVAIIRDRMRYGRSGGWKAGGLGGFGGGFSRGGGATGGW